MLPPAYADVRCCIDDSSRCILQAQTAAYIAGRLALFRGFDKACGASGICSIDYRVATPAPLGAAGITGNYIPRSMHIFRHDAEQGLEVFPNETITFVQSMEGKTQRLLWYVCVFI